MDLSKIFEELCRTHCSDGELIEVCWNEFVNYSDKGRHYHTLAHLGHLYSELEKCRSQIKEWDAVLFALFYHDIIYNVLKHDNEEKSAALAVKRLETLRVPDEVIGKCNSIILATKKHELSPDTDVNLFTDADLSVLGASAEAYSDYAQNVRKEYSIYPDLLYNPGRKKVLQHFLGMPRIFKTEYFFTQYEQQARINLAEELSHF
jgi:predicted metal-dependent HD superfamily phosphohydrolase